MKWSKILTYSGLLLIQVLLSPARGQGIYVRAGIYDFTDVTAREFYQLAPAITMGGDLWKKSQMALHLSGGIAYNAVKYNDHLHHLVLVPIFVMMNYDLPNAGSRIWPTIGAGLSLAGKADVNIDLDKTNYTMTYGFIALGRLNILLKKDLVLMIEGGYNFLMPAVNEEIDISGVIGTIGLRVPLRR